MHYDVIIMAKNCIFAIFDQKMTSDLTIDKKITTSVMNHIFVLLERQCVVLSEIMYN